MAAEVQKKQRASNFQYHKEHHAIAGGEQIAAGPTRRPPPPPLPPPSPSPSSSSRPDPKDPRSMRVSRAVGTKDRHSKVCTVKGLRDRRVRLSVQTAIQLYDLQERLGVNQPSKVVDWLLNAAKDEIDELPPLPAHQIIPLPPQADFDFFPPSQRQDFGLVHWEAAPQPPPPPAVFYHHHGIAGTEQLYFPCPQQAFDAELSAGVSRRASSSLEFNNLFLSHHHNNNNNHHGPSTS